MQQLFVLAIIFYVLGTAGYYAYLFFQRNGLQRVGWWLQGVGFLCQTLLMVWTYMKTGHMPANNLHETLSLVAWALVGVHLGISLKFKIKILGIYAAPLAVLILLVATQFPKEPMQPLDLLKGIWLTTHIITVFIGDAALALAAGTGLLYLIQEHSIKTKTRGFFFRRLPSLELLDNTGHACIVVGFTLLTIGLISGMIYAKIKWSGFWSWDPKEVWSAVTWLFYAVLLHERLAVGWRGRRAAIMAIAGLAVMLFTFFGVNFLLTGHHGQFTRW